MGAAATIEASFIDEKTGQIFTEERIGELNRKAEEILSSFDFQREFYGKYTKIDSYSQFAMHLKREREVERSPWFLVSEK
jgi:hypothetical protein